CVVCCVVVVFIFFFQAEDGIRDRNVTGVQTCALPILIPCSLIYPGLTTLIFLLSIVPSIPTPVIELKCVISCSFSFLFFASLIIPVAMGCSESFSTVAA